VATSVLDAPLPTGAAQPPARRPVPVVLLAAVSGLEAVALLAGGLAGLDGLVAATPRPPGALVAAVLGALAGWIVLCAAGGLAAVDGGGRRLPAGVACAEVALVGALTVVAVAVAVPLPLPLPLPALALLVLAVPVGKLVLLSAPSAPAWAAAQPPRHRAWPAPVAHPRARLATVALIGVALTALAVSTPVAAEPPPTSAVPGR
jgi:hypothetical protein